MKSINRIAFICTLLILLSGCVAFTARFPDKGIWYSSDWNMYINVETETGYKIDHDGKYVFFHYHRDNGNGIHFVYCEVTYEHSADLESIIENAYYSFRNNTLTIEMRESGVECDFIRVNCKEFPSCNEASDPSIG